MFPPDVRPRPCLWLVPVPMHFDVRAGAVHRRMKGHSQCGLQGSRVFGDVVAPSASLGVGSWPRRDALADAVGAPRDVRRGSRAHRATGFSASSQQSRPNIRMIIVELIIVIIMIIIIMITMIVVMICVVIITSISYVDNTTNSYMLIVRTIVITARPQTPPAALCVASGADESPCDSFACGPDARGQAFVIIIITTTTTIIIIICITIVI